MKNIFSLNSFFSIALIAMILILVTGCTKPMGYGLMANRQLPTETTKAPDNKEFYMSLIEQMQNDGMYFASLAHIDAFEKKYDKSPKIELLRATALDQIGQTDAANTVYNTLLDTAVSAQAYHGLGLNAATHGDYVHAIPALKKAAQMDPTDVMLLNDLGFAYLQKGDVASARVPIAKAAELAPTNQKVISNLALYLFLTDNNAKAERVMAQLHLPAKTRYAIRNLAMKLRLVRENFQASLKPVETTIKNTKSKENILENNDDRNSFKTNGPMSSMLDRFSS